MPIFMDWDSVDIQLRQAEQHLQDLNQSRERVQQQFEERANPARTLDATTKLIVVELGKVRQEIGAQSRRVSTELGEAKSRASWLRRQIQMGDALRGGERAVAGALALFPRFMNWVAGWFKDY